MYNLFRKSLRIAAGFTLLFFFNCASVSNSDFIPLRDSVEIDNIFSEERETIVYLNCLENVDILDQMIDVFNLKGVTKSTIKKSTEFYLASGKDFSSGFDVIIKGDFSKKIVEFGLFLSFDWKKIKEDGYRFWRSKKGLDICFIDNSTILVSSFDIKGLIDIVENNDLESPEDSILLLMPDLDKEQLKSLTQGFIKGGIKSLSFSLNGNGESYDLEAIVGLESARMAKAFNILLSRFLKIILSNSDDPNIVKLGKEFQLEYADDSVFISNIELQQKKIVELLNNLIVIKGEADK